jgi:hypothetical protein
MSRANPRPGAVWAAAAAAVLPAVFLGGLWAAQNIRLGPSVPRSSAAWAWPDAWPAPETLNPSRPVVEAVDQAGAAWRLAAVLYQHVRVYSGDEAKVMVAVTPDGRRLGGDDPLLAELRSHAPDPSLSPGSLVQTLIFDVRPGRDSGRRRLEIQVVRDGHLIARNPVAMLESGRAVAHVILREWSGAQETLHDELTDRIARVSMIDAQGSGPWIAQGIQWSLLPPGEDSEPGLEAPPHRFRIETPSEAPGMRVRIRPLQPEPEPGGQGRFWSRIDAGGSGIALARPAGRFGSHGAYELLAFPLWKRDLLTPPPTREFLASIEREQAEMRRRTGPARRFQ